MMSPRRLEKRAAAPLRWLTAVAVLLLTACAPPLPQQPAQLLYPPLAFHIPEVETLTLHNGIRVYLREDNELPLVTLTAMVGSGVLAAEQQLSGFDDLFTATLRNGGAAGLSSTEVEARLDLLAANLGCSMSPYTVQLDLSTRRDDLAAGLAIVADLLRRPAFTADQLELARNAALEGVRRRNDEPGSIAQRLLMAALYPGHPLGASPDEASLKAISREQLLAFHRDHFAPDNLWLAVSGDIRREELVALLDAAFGDWPPGAVAPPPLPPLERPSAGLLQAVSFELPQTTVLLGDLGLTKDDPDQYAARVLNYIFGGGGFNSRLLREIRSDRGLAYSAWSQFQIGRRFPGPVMAGTESGSATAVEALQLIYQIIRDLREAPVSAAELTLAKDSLVNSFVFSFADSHAVVAQRMQFDFYGYPVDYLQRYRERIAAVTVADVQRVAQRYLQPERLQVIVVGAPDEARISLDSLGLPVRRLTVDRLP